MMTGPITPSFTVIDLVFNIRFGSFYRSRDGEKTIPGTASPNHQLLNDLSNERQPVFLIILTQK
ncbi:MAG: hypothetical protein JNM88_20630 [Chitinophagaceae bacterium]|nr:hypothetical protein [Chitinophagaceae bacterium]